MPERFDTAIRLVEHAFVQLENDAKQGRYAPPRTKFAGSVARLLGREDIARRCAKLLGDTPDTVFWNGILTNIALPEAVPPQMRSIPSLAELEEAFPTYSESRVVAYIRQCAETERHLALALERRYEEAFDQARTDLQVEEIALAQAVLGDMEAAVDSAVSQVSSGDRRFGVFLVLTVELFRRGRVAEAHRQLAALDSGHLNVWSAGQLALGIADRQPWQGYPYPDW
jgi:hypothetical protein